MKLFLPITALSLLAVLPGCATSAGSDGVSRGAAPLAFASLTSADGSPRGDATITQDPDGLRVVVRGQGLTPGIHAVHIHTNGQCVRPDFSSAGGHWNPTARQHGKDNPAGMHMGDMPNLLAAPDGSGAIEYLIAGGSISGGTASLLDADGAAVVIHAAADDNKSDPAGNAGGRVACGVISAQ